VVSDSNSHECLSIQGWAVATLTLDRRGISFGDAIPDRVFLFRSLTSWALLALRCRDFEETEDRVAHASVTLWRFSSTNELRAHIENTYAAGSFYDIAEAGRDEPELFLAWLPERVSRDFDRASVVDKDLALSTGVFGGEALPAPGRQLQGWRLHALNVAAARLGQLGFEVVSASEERPGGDPDQERKLGEVSVRRYGFEVRGVVRVDPAGEIYVRLPDDALFSPVVEAER
jgi:hypothetical protein